MDLTERVSKAKEYEKEIYGPLRDDPVNLDEIFNVFVSSIRDHYAGYGQKKQYFTPAEYHTYIYSHFRYQSLTVEMLVRSLHQMVGDLHDRHLTFTCDDWIDYKNLAMKYRVRAYQDVLYVTTADPDTGLVPGDRILQIQHMTPEKIRKYTRNNCFYSRVPERELWGGYLRMAKDVLVRHENGNKELINLKLYPLADNPVIPEKEYPIRFERKEEQTAYLQVQRMDSAALNRLLCIHKEEIENSRKLILDLRRNIGGEETALDGLLPYIIDRPVKRSELTAEEGSYVLCTQRNCRIRVKQMEEYLAGMPQDTGMENTLSDQDIAVIEEEIRFYKENAGKGLVFRQPDRLSQQEDPVIEPAKRSPQKIILLTDTFCENEGEAFAAMCQRAGSKVISVGRPTMGTLDYDDPITICEHEHMYLSYPIRMTKAAYEGRGISEKGLPVDEYIAWTPQEIHEDVILKRAMET